MPRLLHLNGPPGIGKSTLAQRYADEHAGVLNLDVDDLRPFIGGWREDYCEAGALARPMALAMADAHLRGGRDVVFPHFLGNLPEIERFAGVAQRAGAEFVELVLIDDKESAITRFAQRGDDDTEGRFDQIQKLVHNSGGDEYLASLYDRLLDVVARRDNTRLLKTQWGDLDGSYAALCSVLVDPEG
ncbi:MAG: AAA family ATPase [Nocardioides sp.]